MKIIRNEFSFDNWRCQLWIATYFALFPQMSETLKSCILMAVRNMLDFTHFLQKMTQILAYYQNVSKHKLEKLFYRDRRVQRKIRGPGNINVPFSIKHTLFKTFKSALLNVPLNLKNWGLNNYKKGTHNRNMRVL